MAIQKKFNTSNPNHVKLTVECGPWKQVWLCARDNAVECVEGTLEFLDRVNPLPGDFVPTVQPLHDDAVFDRVVGQRNGGG